MDHQQLYNINMERILFYVFFASLILLFVSMVVLFDTVINKRSRSSINYVIPKTYVLWMVKLYPWVLVMPQMEITTFYIFCGDAHSALIVG